MNPALTADAAAGPAVPTEPAENAIFSFVAAVGAGDPAAAARCFTREGCLITPDGTAVHGRREIAGILAQLIARRTELEVVQVAVRRAGDVAVASGRLTMRSDGPEGERIAQSCLPTIALREVEATWKIAILAPWASPER